MGFPAALVGAVVGGGVSALGGALGARKQRKEANRAGGEILRDTDEAFETARARITPFMDDAKQRSGIASIGLKNALLALNRGDFTPSENVLNTIEDLSTQAREQAAATGRSQSGGLQGELERIRTGLILDDARDQRSHQLNMLRTLSPFTQEPIKLQGIMADLDLDELQRVTAARNNQLANVSSAIGKQFNALGQGANTALNALGFTGI